MTKRRPTLEQQRAAMYLGMLAAPYRFRVIADAEGFPIIPGRYGRIEWYCDGESCWSCPLPRQAALAVYTEHPRLPETLGHSRRDTAPDRRCRDAGRLDRRVLGAGGGCDPGEAVGRNRQRAAPEFLADARTTGHLTALGGPSASGPRGTKGLPRIAGNRRRDGDKFGRGLFLWPSAGQMR
jgi:hypothetical protein